MTHDQSRRGACTRTIAALRECIERPGWASFLIASYLLVIAVFVIMWTALLVGPLRQGFIDQQIDNLTAVADAGAYAYGNFPSSDARQIVSDISDHGKIRATVIAPDGVVVADSEQNPATLENHLKRPEVQKALAGQTGTAIRVSKSDGLKRLYVAVPYHGTSGKGEGVFRVSEPLSHATGAIRSAQRAGILLLAIGIVLVVVVAFTTLKSAVKPVGHLQRVRTDFVANASHELKTPVAGIKLLAESIDVAARDGDTEFVSQFAQRLNDEATRLQNLVTDLLDLSRLEQFGDKAVLKSEVDLHTALSTSVESRRVAADAKNLYLKFVDETPAGVSTRFPIAPADVSLIVDNLIDNAIRYTEKGGVSVKLVCSEREAILTVTDTGIGLSDKDIPRIFERFYRVDVARSREQGGTGLGLSLVRHAVLRARGTVEVDSKLNYGSTFKVRIPR